MNTEMDAELEELNLPRNTSMTLNILLRIGIKLETHHLQMEITYIALGDQTFSQIS